MRFHYGKERYDILVNQLGTIRKCLRHARHTFKLVRYTVIRAFELFRTAKPMGIERSNVRNYEITASPPL